MQPCWDKSQECSILWKWKNTLRWRWGPYGTIPAVPTQPSPASSCSRNCCHGVWEVYRPEKPYHPIKARLILGGESPFKTTVRMKPVLCPPQNQRQKFILETKSVLFFSLVLAGSARPQLWLPWHNLQLHGFAFSEELQNNLWEARKQPDPLRKDIFLFPTAVGLPSWGILTCNSKWPAPRRRESRRDLSPLLTEADLYKAPSLGKYFHKVCSELWATSWEQQEGSLSRPDSLHALKAAWHKQPFQRWHLSTSSICCLWLFVSEQPSIINRGVTGCPKGQWR